MGRSSPMTIHINSDFFEQKRNEKVRKIRIKDNQISYESISQIKSFCCSDKPDVELLIKESAMNDHVQNLAKTYLVFKKDEYIGYFLFVSVK